MGKAGPLHFTQVLGVGWDAAVPAHIRPREKPRGGPDNTSQDTEHQEVAHEQCIVPKMISSGKKKPDNAYTMHTSLRPSGLLVHAILSPL